MIENTVNLETTSEAPAWPFSFQPGEIVGYRRNGKPIYNIAGGSIDVTTDDVVDDDTDDDDEVDEDVEEVEDEWVPPTKAEFDRLLNEKKKADSESAARKRLLRDAGLDPKTGKPVQKKPVLDLDDLDDDDDADEAESARQAAKGETKARSDKAFQRQLEREIAKTERRIRDEATVLMSAVPQALNDAGWNGRNLDRMLKLLDLDEIQVDSDGEIDGLLDQVDELKKDFPEFFKRQRMREAAKGVADTKTVGGGKKTAPASETDLDWTARLKAQFLQGS